jgi:protein-S-isoprenylcysteine O-methyltransferase Ste14
VFAQAPDTLLEWALLVAGASTLMVFAVALQNFFVQPPRLSRGQRFFQDFSVMLGVTHGLALLVLDSAGDMWAGIGIGMYTVSLTVFLAAIEAARRVPMTRTFVYEPKCDTILTTGPYRVIRHPIYLSYSLAWSAAPVATHNPVLALSAIVMITCYVISAREEERRLALGSKRDEYAAVRARTWRMIPFLY